MPAVKTIPSVEPKLLALCNVKHEHASELTREETAALMSWCDCQREDLWETMALQEILNVYRATAAWDTFESWADEDWRAAYAAWDSAVINPGNRMRPRQS